MAMRALRLHGRWMGIGLFGGFVAALLVFTFQPRVWKAEIIIAPVAPSVITVSPSSSVYYSPTIGMNATARTASPDIAANDTMKADDFIRFETMMTSPDIVQHFTQQYGHLVPQGINDVYRYFNRHIMIRPHGLTPYRKVTFHTTDRDKAADILSALYTLTDQSIRNERKEKSRQLIEALNRQLDTPVMSPSKHDVLLTMLRQEEQKLMMASIDQPFAADIIRAPYVNPAPVAPNAVILFPLLMITGATIGLIAGGYRRNARVFGLRYITRAPRKIPSNANDPLIHDLPRKAV